MSLAFPLKHNFFFAVLFPFLTPIYEMLNICMFPKNSISFFQKFVYRIKETHLDSTQKVMSGGVMRESQFDNLLGCEQVSCVLMTDR